MLNTDLHNPQVRVRGIRNDIALLFRLTLISQKRMTIEDYQRNLRGVNDGSDFSPEYLVSDGMPRDLILLFILLIASRLQLNTKARDSHA
jgi:hypothetical protein